jgi:cell shape-determining protein MreC
MARKQTRISRRMLFTWLMLVGFILLFAPAGLTNKLPFTFAYIFRWPLSMSRSIVLSAPVEQQLPNAPTRTELQYQNHIANLEKLLKEQQDKFDRLYGLYNGTVSKGMDFAEAGVITHRIVGPRNELLIDCRNDTGLVKGQYILADNSVIGTITDISSHTARVRLFTDTSSKISVQIGDNVKRVMLGAGDNTAKVQHVPVEYKVNVGDKVFAYRQPGFLDAPMVVGQVTTCKRDENNPLLWDITVQPRCRIDQLENVNVIIMNPQK